MNSSFSNEKNSYTDILIKKYELNQQMFTAKSTDGISWRAEPYEIIANDETTTTFQLILYTESKYRFSNSLIQLVNMVYLAKYMDAKSIFIPNYWFIPENELNEIEGIKIEFSNKYPGDINNRISKENEVFLKGNFFYLDSILPAYKRVQINRYKILNSIKEKLEISYQKPLPLEYLVIHIRGGDIFSTNIHPGYGQPPFAFYQFVISKYNFKIVKVVCEDLLNPVIQSIKTYCDRNCIEFSIISGNLRSDIEFLLRAQNIVVGRGTFSSGVLSLSHNAKNVYFFESGYSSWGNSNLNIIKIRDLGGEYKEKILSNNWVNSIEQINLMLEYPISKIG